ncbi:integrase, catalytic region, zinc finger, CCHC-type containing protein [Tanacetum coccineum]|uniref:Integrase, catalytic region, zinc finger, CCHC-type containing protein n=1 Tax=Tanacetum coccineum TaxID=301880 RepID=A0ABQ4YJ02_9ASTR
MAHIQPADNNDDSEPKHDAKTINDVNASQIHLKSRMHSNSVHEHMNHVKLKTIINTSDDDQIDSSIIFDDPYVDNNSGTDKHDLNAKDQYVALESLIYNVKKEAENEHSLNNELKKQKALLQKELETCKERLSKKDFKEHEKSYLDELVDLGEKLSSHDRIVYKMGQLIQTIHMLGKKPNKVYDPFLKAELGYQNLERLKKAIKAQPNMYDVDCLQSTKLIIVLPDYEETLEDVKQSRLKIKDKMIQLDYEKLNALYETFVPQTEIPIEQTYLSTPSTSNVHFESSIEMSDLPVKKMPNESKLLKLFIKLDRSIGDLQTQIDQTLLKDRSKALMCLNEIKQEIKEETYAYADVHAKNQDLLITISELKVKLAEQATNVNTKFDKSMALEKLVCITPLNKNKYFKATTVSKVQIKTNKSKPVTSCSTPENEQSQLKNANVIARGVAYSNSVSRSESKDNNSKKRVLLNTKVKRALFTSPITAKSSKVEATPVVVKSSGCSKHMNGNMKLLRNFVEKFMGIVRFGNDNFTAFTRYGDYVQGKITICHVYYVEGLRHNLFSVGQFCDEDLEVAFRSNTCFVWNLEGEDLLTGFHESNIYTISIFEMATSSPDQVLKIRSDNETEFKNATMKSFYEKLGILHQTLIARMPQQNGVVEHRNKTLIEAARIMLIFSKLPEFLWAKAISITCFTQNRSLMKPKAEIGFFVGYSESSRRFCVYSSQTRKIMETIHVKFDELTAMASECNNSGPDVNCSNFQDSSEEMNEIPSQQDMDNLFGPHYEEYYAPRTSDVLDNSTAKTLDNEDTPLSSSIIVEDNDAPQIVSASDESISKESGTSVLETHSDEQIQEDVAELNENTIMHSFEIPEFEEAESSSNFQDPSNMHEFHQQHRYTDKWTKMHLIK